MYQRHGVRLSSEACKVTLDGRIAVSDALLDDLGFTEVEKAAYRADLQGLEREALAAIRVYDRTTRTSEVDDAGRDEDTTETWRPPKRFSQLSSRASACQHNPHTFVMTVIEEAQDETTLQQSLSSVSMASLDRPLSGQAQN